MLKEKLRTALVGLGAVGSRNDGGRIRQFPLSHAGAVFQNQAFELVAALEPDPANQRRFSEEWNREIRLFSKVNDLAEAQGEIDLVVIASPTPTHFPILHELLQRRTLKAIFCEKPFCSNQKEARQIIEVAESRGTEIVVNYHRRWDSKITHFRKELQACGKPHDVQVVYGKGLYNYGSHIIDLMVSCWGSVFSVRADRLRPEQASREDPSVSATIEFLSGVRARINGCDGVDYDLFDMDISYQSWRFHLEAGGYRIRRLVSVPDLYFSGYSHLQETDSAYADGPVAGLHKAYEELEAFLRKGVVPGTSTPDNALHVLRVLDAIRESAARDGKKINL